MTDEKIGRLFRKCSKIEQKLRKNGAEGKGFKELCDSCPSLDETTEEKTMQIARIRNRIAHGSGASEDAIDHALRLSDEVIDELSSSKSSSRNSSKSSSSDDGEGCGCILLEILLEIIIGWAVLFGVLWGLGLPPSHSAIFSTVIVFIVCCVRIGTA